MFKLSIKQSFYTAEKLKPIPADFGRKVGQTLDSTSIQRRANQGITNDLHPHLWVNQSVRKLYTGWDVID